MSEANIGNIHIPGMPDLEKVKQTLQKAEAGTLDAEQQAAAERYLQESFIAIHRALPTLEQLEGVTKGIEQLIHEVNLKKLRATYKEPD